MSAVTTAAPHAHAEPDPHASYCLTVPSGASSPGSHHARPQADRDHVFDLRHSSRSCIRRDVRAARAHRADEPGQDDRRREDSTTIFFSLHGIVMVFLVIIPSIPAAMGNFVMPIQLGAKDVAFPRLNLLSLYIYIFGACFGLYSMVHGGVDTGWTFYTPYSARSESYVIPMTLAAFIMGFSSILTGVNFIATVHKMRAPGMSWGRLPLFVWALYATRASFRCSRLAGARDHAASAHARTRPGPRHL